MVEYIGIDTILYIRTYVHPYVHVYVCMFMHAASMH